VTDGTDGQAVRRKQVRRVAKTTLVSDRHPTERQSRCRSQRVQHAKHVHLRDVAQIVGCCLFQPGCVVVGIYRDGCVVLIKYLRRLPVNMVAGLLRPPFNDLAYFCPCVLGALSGVDFSQPPQMPSIGGTARVHD